MNQLAPKLPDEYYATQIRNAIKELNKLVCEGQDVGLTIKLELGQVGQRSWVGYHDAASIMRKY